MRTAGTFQIPISTDTGTVTGLAIPFDTLMKGTVRVFPTVRKPPGGFNMFANIMGSPNAAGFQFSLSGQTDSGNYYLDYLIFA